MFEITIKFETEADKESFVSSITNSFNRSGKFKSIHANSLDRVGNTLLFTRQPETDEPASLVSDSPVAYISIETDGIVGLDYLLSNQEPNTLPETEVGSDGGGDFAGGGAGGSFDAPSDPPADTSAFDGE